MDTLFEFFPFVIYVVLAVPPCLKLCKRLGLPVGYVALILVPALGVFIFLYVVAFCLWPIKDAEGKVPSLAA